VAGRRYGMAPRGRGCYARGAEDEPVRCSLLVIDRIKLHPCDRRGLGQTGTCGSVREALETGVPTATL
jgi:hypothetical protein